MNQEVNPTESKKRKLDGTEQEHEPSTKRQKLESNDVTSAELQALSELPADPLLHLFEFVGARSLLALGITCSKFKTLIDSRLPSLISRVFVRGYDLSSQSNHRAIAVTALHDAAKIDQCLGSRVRLTQLVSFPQASGYARLDSRRPAFALLAWDERKIISVTNGQKKLSITCTVTGKDLVSLDFEEQIWTFAASQMNQIAVVTGADMTSGRTITTYAFDDKYNATKIGSFNHPIEAPQYLNSVAWTNTNDLMLIKSYSYVVCTVTGENIRSKSYDVNEEGGCLIIVSPDGSFAVRAEYESSGEPALFYKIDLLNGTEKRFYKLESVADFMTDLRFVGTNTDLISWYCEGTGESATYLYDMKTNKRTLHAVLTGVDDYSRDGTRVVSNSLHGDYSSPPSIIDIKTKKAVGKPLEMTGDKNQTEYFMTFYHWTYPTETEPKEKILTSGSNHVLVFDPQTGNFIAKLQHTGGHTLRLKSVSKDNKTILFTDETAFKAQAVVWSFE